MRRAAGTAVFGLEAVDGRLPCLRCKAIACGGVRCVPDHEVGNKQGKHRKQDQKHGGCLKGARPGISLEAAVWHGDHPSCWCNTVRGFGGRLLECLVANRIQIASETVGGTSGGLKVWCVVIIVNGEAGPLEPVMGEPLWWEGACKSGCLLCSRTRARSG